MGLNNPGSITPTTTSSIPTVTTHPDAYYRHSISDEEVDVFVNSSRDGLTDVMWGALSGPKSIKLSGASTLI